MFELERPQGKSFDEWLKMDDFRQFLLDSAHGDVPIYYHDGKAGGLVFLSSLLLPNHLFHDGLIEELVNWQDNPVESGWGYGTQYHNHEEEHTVIFLPYSSIQPDILQHATPILTRRTNSLFMERPVYYEINPQISQIHDLHWSTDNNAYCTLDENGDIWEVVKVQIGERHNLVTLAEPILYKHLVLGDYLLLRFFDLDRWEGEMPMPDAEDYAAMVYWHDQDIHARWTPVHRADGSIGRVFLRGFQILRPTDNPGLRQEMIEGKPKLYCTFFAMDWKHGRVGEYSCDPYQLGNYFEKSDLPFETSPAFFKEEVLRKYQSDPEKYLVKDRRIECRSSWDLPFDINPEGQVHAYLIDLSRLPYAEQLHWKASNEPPKGGISCRAYKTDFLAEWDREPEPLRDLKYLLNEFPSAKEKDKVVPVWQKPTGADARLADQVHYPTGNVRQVWETDIIKLDKLVIEGLNLKHLRQIANSLDIRDEKLGSILLLQNVLSALSIADDLVAAVIDPLYELHDLRSKFASHRAGTDADQVAKDLRRKHQSLANHFRDLVVRIYEGLSILADLVQKEYLSLS